jgi:transcriptional regulator with XRE-family HTH domain
MLKCGFNFANLARRSDALSSMNRFGNHIRLTRQQADFTQYDLAERVGINQSVLSRIENGDTAAGLKVTRALCDALGLGSPWPAVATVENYCQKVARETGITAQQAAAELRDAIDAAGEKGNYLVFEPGALDI